MDPSNFAQVEKPKRRNNFTKNMRSKIKQKVFKLGLQHLKSLTQISDDDLRLQSSNLSAILDSIDNDLLKEKLNPAQFEIKLQTLFFQWIERNNFSQRNQTNENTSTGYSPVNDAEIMNMVKLMLEKLPEIKAFYQQTNFSGENDERFTQRLIAFIENIPKDGNIPYQMKDKVQIYYDRLFLPVQNTIMNQSQQSQSSVVSTPSTNPKDPPQPPQTIQTPQIVNPKQMNTSSPFSNSLPPHHMSSNPNFLSQNQNLITPDQNLLYSNQSQNLISPNANPNMMATNSNAAMMAQKPPFYLPNQMGYMQNMQNMQNMQMTSMKKQTLKHSKQMNKLQSKGNSSLQINSNSNQPMGKDNSTNDSDLIRQKVSELFSNVKSDCSVFYSTPHPPHF